MGVDVSTYQNGIDWNDAKAAGVDFAIIRIGFRGYGEAGRMQPDDWFVRNIEAAKAARRDGGSLFLLAGFEYI